MSRPSSPVYLFVGLLLVELLPGAHAEEQKPAGFDLKPYIAAAERIELAVNENDAKLFPELLDVQTLMDRVFAQLPNVDPQFRTGFEKPLQGIGREVMTEWAKAVLTGGGFKLLDVRMVDGAPRGIARMLKDDGVNYIELIFSTDGGPPRMIDAYVTLSAENLSQTLARVAAMGLAELQPDAPADGIVKHGATIVKVTKMVQANLPDEALVAYQSLPRKLQKEKMMMLMYVMIRGKKAAINSQAYTDAIDEFTKLYPNDLAVELIAIDALFLRKQYKEGLEAVDRIDKVIGGDPYLDILRGKFYWVDGKLPEARAAMERAIKAEPELRQGHLSILDICIAQKDYARLAEALTILESEFQMNFGGVATAAVFEGFRNSPEYEKWEQKR